MDTDSLVQFMRQLPLFAAYADDDVIALAHAAQIRALKAGQRVFSQGDAAETFYLVHEALVFFRQPLDSVHMSLPFHLCAIKMDKPLLPKAQPCHNAYQKAEDN